MTTKHVELLIFDGCPNVDATVERARDAIREAQVCADLRIVSVENDDQARNLLFLGSPTVRVDGIDVDPSTESRSDYGLQCRVYNVSGRLENVPPSDWIVAALRG